MREEVYHYHKLFLTPMCWEKAINQDIDSPPHSGLVSTSLDLNSVPQSRELTIILSSCKISVADLWHIHTITLSLAKQASNSKELISWELNVLW